MTNPSEQQLSRCRKCGEPLHEDHDYGGADCTTIYLLKGALSDIEVAVIKNPERPGTTAQATLDHVRAVAQEALNDGPA